MAEKVEIDIEVNSNIEPTIANLKALKKQLKETAAGSAEFNKISAQIRDMDDAIKDASATSDDFAGYLENASGPLGMLGKGLRNAEKTFSSFNAVLKTSVIGILVTTIGGLVGAFTQSETAMKKLQPLFIAMEKILGGIFRAFEPVLDAFIEMATRALPYITKGIGMYYSALYSLFTLVKNVGLSVGQILKGIFTLDFDALKEGAAGIKDAFTNVGKTFNDTYKRFEAGTKEQTKTEKENAEERQKNADAAAAKRKAAAEKAAAEEEKRREEKKKKDDAAASAELDAFKETLSEQERAEYEAGLKLNERKKALLEAGKTDFTIVEEAYQKELADIRKKAADEQAEKDKDKAEKDKEALLKKQADERGILLTGLQSQLEELDRANQQQEFDFQQDLERLKQQKSLLAQQEATELQNTELTEFQRTEIRKKYADARQNITDKEVQTERAALEAKRAMNMQYIDLFAQFGQLLQQVAGKSKGVAIAGIVIEQAASIAKIVANTGVAIAKLSTGLPFTAPAIVATKISAGLSIASTIAAAAKSISQIKSTTADSASGGGGGASAPTIPSAPPPTFSGSPAAMGAPQIQTTVGATPGSQIAQTIGAAQNRPIVAQVVSSAVSSQQALDRRTNVAATFSGG
jgi:hypothetical protein